MQKSIMCWMKRQEGQPLDLRPGQLVTVKRRYTQLLLNRAPLVSGCIPLCSFINTELCKTG
jgi:hypothetical protein